MKALGTTNLKLWLSQHDHQTKQKTKAWLLKLITKFKKLPAKERVLKTFEGISESAKKVGPVSCSAGCSFCCHQSIHICDEEADLIVDHIKKNDISINMLTLKKHAAWDKKTYYEKRDEAACVFLSSEGKCNIYDARPASCRTYLVNSDPLFCDTKYRHKHPKLQVAISRDMEIYASALWSLSSGEIESMPKKLWAKITTE